MDHVLCDHGMILRSGVIVDNCCVGSSSADGLETKAFVVLLLVPEIVEVLCSLVVINAVQFRSPIPELSHRHSIYDMASSKTIHLLLCPNCPVQSDSLPFDWLFVDD